MLCVAYSDKRALIASPTGGRCYSEERTSRLEPDEALAAHSSGGAGSRLVHPHVHRLSAQCSSPVST
ncbi:unnamed protein product [Boreogadus saida]